MASPRGYEHLEPTEDPHAAAAAQAALEAQILATQEARRAGLEAAQAAELAQQERLREAMREAQLVGVTSAAEGDWRDGIAVRAPNEPERVAADREPPTPPAPLGWTWPAAESWDPQYTRPQPMSAGHAGRERGVHDSVDHVEAEGLGSKQREQLGFAYAEASAGAVEPAAREGGAREEAEADRCDGGHAQGVTENVLPVNQALVQAWWDWMDAESAAIGLTWEPATLNALATADYANSVDTDFVDRVISEVDDPDDGNVYQRRGGEIWARWQAHRAQRPKINAAELEALRAHIDRKWPRGSDGSRPDVGARVQIIQDRGHTFPGGDPQAFARDYLRTLPSGWTESIVISLRPSERVVICRWSAERVRHSDTVMWAEHGPRIDDRQRFVALRDHDFEGARVMIPASQLATESRVQPTTLQELASSKSDKASEGGVPIWSTGIAALDAALSRTHGIPRGARVVVQASTGQAKTIVLLEWAESLAARGLTVVYVATGDDDDKMIQGRRRQRVTTLSQKEALACADSSMLNPKLMVFNGRAHLLEDILAFRNEIDVIVLDPVTKIRTRDDGQDDVANVGRVLKLIEASGLTTIMAGPTVRNASKRVALERSFGGSKVESGAAVVLELSRAPGSADVAVSILKSRYGGENTELTLRVDFASQRVLATAAADAPLPLEERIWLDLRGVLAEGPLSERTLAEKRVRGRAVVVRGVIQSRLASGELVKVGGKVALPPAAA